MLPAGGSGPVGAKLAVGFAHLTAGAAGAEVEVGAGGAVGVAFELPEHDAAASADDGEQDRAHDPATGDGRAHRYSRSRTATPRQASDRGDEPGEQDQERQHGERQRAPS